MALRKRRPPCQSCESQRLRRMSGCWANDGSVPISYYKCLDCGMTGLTAEFWLPPGTAMNSLDFDRRLANRIIKRRSRGVTGRARDVRGGRRITSDQLIADIRIIPGRVERGLAKRLADLRRKRSGSPVVAVPHNEVRPLLLGWPCRRVPGCGSGGGGAAGQARRDMADGRGPRQARRLRQAGGMIARRANPCPWDNQPAEIAAKSHTLECARPGGCAISHLPGHCVTGDRP